MCTAIRTQRTVQSGEETIAVQRVVNRDRHKKQSVQQNKIMADSKLSSAQSSSIPRFQLASDEDLFAILQGADSKNTKKQIKFSLSVFEQYLAVTNASLPEVNSLQNSELVIMGPIFFNQLDDKNICMGCIKQI
mgnify:CR=1 FL=1